MFDYKYKIFDIKYRRVDILCVSLIIIWALVLSVFVKDVKAYSDLDSFSFDFNFGGQNYLGDVISGNIDSSISMQNNSRGVFFKRDDISYSLNNFHFEGGIYFFYTGNYSFNYNGSVNPGWVYPYINNNGSLDYEVNNKFHNEIIGVNSEWNVTVFYNSVTITYDEGDTIINRGLIFDNVEYVNSDNDLIDFLNGNDSVVNSGNPFDDSTIQDDSLPVPQELGTDIQNDNLGTPPFISGVWKNPSDLLEAYSREDIIIDIQYKPMFQYYKNFFNLKAGRGLSENWIDIYSGSIGTYDRWIRYNAESGYPDSNSTILASNMASDIINVANSSGIDNYSPRSTQIDNGSTWRCRYRVGNKASLWVVFNINSVGSLSNKESISFQNNSGDAVPASDVNYENSSQTSNSSNTNLGNFFDNLSANISSIINSTNNAFNSTDSNTGGFFGFFKSFFDKFPQMYALLILGLAVAILLRILGR